MKFTDGYWMKRAGWDVRHPRHVKRVEAIPNAVRAFAPTKKLEKKGDELDTPQVTITLQPVADGVIRVRLEHFRGYVEKKPNFQLNTDDYDGEITVEEATASATVQAGPLQAQVGSRDDMRLRFFVNGEEVTSSILKSIGIATSPQGKKYLHEQLVIQPGEAVYGLGERFGPVVKNGQTIDLWNADGGTASEQAYKNVPFYLTSRGYGVFVNHPELVSFEVGSEVNSRVQFSVAGDYLEYFVIAGPTPKDVLRRYTALTGRPANVPAWSYGLWLSTSFTTDYSEATVNEFIDKMEELDLPLKVLHFDCYWMRPSHWCDFTWDPDMFPDPKSMLERYHQRGLKVCVWINPYISQQSHLFDEGKAKGYLLKTRDGAVRQWDHWQPGMAWVDFTNPDAVDWYKKQLAQLLEEGVDCFKTDFGERVPTDDVAWFDGSDPQRMHNYYSLLYNRAVFEVIREVRGQDEAIVFARAASSGGQQFPTHWGGDSEPTFESMGETLRGGLSLSMSGFGFWSHDMGGFEGRPDPDVFIRWFPFGMLSTHSRLHGSNSYRVPWIYGDEAVRCARRFIALKNRLVPYIASCAQQATSCGTPVMRHMALEFPQDRGCEHVDTQYMFGPKLLVAPVMHAKGWVDYYLPSDGWTNLLDGRRIERAGWQREQHDYDSLPIMVPDGTVLPVGASGKDPDYHWDEEVCLYFFGPQVADTTVDVPTRADASRQFTIERTGNQVTVSTDPGRSDWSICVVNQQIVTDLLDGNVCEDAPAAEIVAGTHITPDSQSGVIRFTTSQPNI